MLTVSIAKRRRLLAMALAGFGIVSVKAQAGAAATYLDIWREVADAAGNHVAYGRAFDGAVQRLRLDDGIHFTPSGYDLLAARVMAMIRLPK